MADSEAAQAPRSEPVIVSELGLERRCLTCGEYWPADHEFYPTARSRKDGLSVRCIACVHEKNWGRREPWHVPTPQRT